MTPDPLAKAIVEHFAPTGAMLDPCKGTGAFLKYMPGADWCEIEEGRDFFAYKGRVNWIITNPPWSKMRRFLDKAFKVANNVAFLMSLNHSWTETRCYSAYEAGFHIDEIIMLREYPVEFPASGFQLGVVCYKRGPVPLDDTGKPIARLGWLSWTTDSKAVRPKKRLRAACAFCAEPTAKSILCATCAGCPQCCGCPRLVVEEIS